MTQRSNADGQDREQHLADRRAQLLYDGARSRGQCEGYREGYKDGLAEPRACTCEDEFDKWTEVYEAGWNMGHQAALDGR